jgi:hypothetical protein
MLVPYFVNGRVRIANVPSNASAREREWIAQEESRIQVVARCRMYYDGTQYDEANLATAKTLFGDNASVIRLPEHDRLHAYSVQIQESVDFIADQLTEGFAVNADDQQVQDVVDEVLNAAELLSSGEEEDREYVVEPLVRECLKVGDVAVELRWDPINEVVFPVFWDSEQVQFVNPTGTVVDRVVRTELVWVFKDGHDVQVRERVEFSVDVNPAHGVEEAVKRTYWDEGEGPRSEEWLGLPFIPWILLRAHRESLRALRGASLVSTKVMDNADRYDAVEQQAYLIARFNSHGNLAVVGDAASLTLKTEGQIQKDVADVLTFPGGTGIVPITLPTDPAMIEHQRKVTSDAIYQGFGLVRVEPDTIQGLGSISGYALEILNRKTEGTFRRVRRQFRNDFLRFCGMVLDITAYKREAEIVAAPFAEDLGPDTFLPVEAFWDVDPDAVFPNRKMEIRMGSGYVVDDVGIRDDYTANLISRQEALRQRGYDDTDIDKIEQEIKDAAPVEATVVPETVDQPTPPTQEVP